MKFRDFNVCSKSDKKTHLVIKKMVKKKLNQLVIAAARAFCAFRDRNLFYLNSLSTFILKINSIFFPLGLKMLPFLSKRPK